MSSAKFALAAAHNITPRMIATWDPYQHRTPRVMVPVHLDVMMVRDDGEKWANCKMTDPDPNAGLQQRRDLLPPPFSELDKPRPRGAYLHWALPDALTHGTSDGKTGNFPVVPDRWLVLRLYPGSNGARRAVAGWVIRAGDKVPSATTLDQWKETGPSGDVVKNALTALGHGDPAWAAYYDNVVTADAQGNQLPRLGFYDSLAGVKTGPLAYIVCGWYSDPASDDPLGDANVKSLSDFDAAMNKLLWHIDDGEFSEALLNIHQRLQVANMAGLSTLEYTGINVSTAAIGRAGVAPGAAAIFKRDELRTSIGATPAPLDGDGKPVGGSYVTNGAWWPKLSFYHGAVVGIGWPGVGWPGVPDGVLGKPPQALGTAGGEFGGAPQASSIHVAVGNTLTEALGALVAQANKSPQEAQMLEAFLLGGVAEVDKADGQAQVDALLHAASFATRDDGFTSEDIQQPPMPDLAPPKPAPVTPDPGIFANNQTVQVNTNFKAVSTLSNAVGIGEPIHNSSIEFVRESTIIRGGLSAVMGTVFPTPAAPTTQPGKTVTVNRSKPRFFQPADPVLLVEGAARSFKHGGDGRFTQDGKLICRLTGFCVTELTTNTGQTVRPSVSGDDILERGVENGSVPYECEDILREVALADPGSAAVAARASGVGTTQIPLATTRFMVEQTAIWAARDPRFDAAPLLARSGFRGTLPSPISINLPVRPWNPIHLDWELEYVASAGGAADWTLDETDYVTDKFPDTPGIVLSGRAHLTAGAASTAAQSVRTALQQAAASAGTEQLAVHGPERSFSPLSLSLLLHLDSLATQVATNTSGSTGTSDGPPAIDRSALNDIVSALDNMDVLTGALDNFHTRLRGGLKGDGVSVPNGPVPSPFIPIRAGFLKIRRLRLVDGFGQFVDLAGSSDAANVDLTQILTTGPAAVPNEPGIAALPPRFTSPARIWLRYLNATDDTQDATTSAPPVCGYLVPNHIDGALEFFDNQGANLGIVRPDAQAGIVWEDAPGTPSTVGTDPAHAVSDARLAGIAQGLIQWGLSDAMVEGKREDALSALLRVIDSTLWAVDPFGHFGDEHMSLLIGHPVAVMRARVRLEVQEPVTPDVIRTTRVPLRLGALIHWQDGLLGYFVNDDYTSLYCADAAAAGFAREVGPNRGFLQQINLVPDFYQQFSNDLGADVTEGTSPVNHPFVDTSGILWIAPNQDYFLTLLVEPHCVVHATTGLLPRKDIGMRREWVADALAKISPTFRFGPLLVDPKRVRMPVANEIKGTWSWDHRADVAHWEEDPVINSTGDAIIPPDPVNGTEGWLKLGPPPPSTTGTT
ncbi:MAG TPA: hypothetical protein VKH81_00245 [Candidatus Angelobacter sp.]|nr:hypothetical protein [Candidatus Angelobacter sp.]